jgi:hypothetical protein
MASLAEQLGQNINTVLGPKSNRQPFNIFGAQSTVTPEASRGALRAQLQGIRGAQRQLRQGFRESRDVLRGEVGQATEALRPITDATRGALARFSRLNRLGGESAEEALEELRSGPGFKFRFEQGIQAARTGLNAAGIQGGRALQELQEEGQQLAAQEAQNVSSRLLGLISLGTPAFQQEASLRAGLGTQLAGLRSQLSSDLADASLAAGQARAQTRAQQGSTLRLFADENTRRRLQESGVSGIDL